MAELRPLEIVHADLADGLPELPEPADGRDVQLVLWWRDLPLGATKLSARGLPPRALADRIAHAVADAAGERLLGTGFEGADPGAGLPVPPTAADLAALLGVREPLSALDRDDGSPAALPRTSLVICTRDRPEQLERCLASVARARRAPDEVLVVDNRPDGATRAVAGRFAGSRYVAEPRPGLSAARNAGIRAATGEVIAFVDDDTEVHPNWLEPLCAPFAEPEVMAVTGLVLAAELDTPAQLRFEYVLGGFARGFRPLRYDQAFFERTRGHAAPVWKIGAGANMAVRAQALERVGHYDERLGAGASGCSEDSELWYRLLAEGWECRYEPASVVFHHHRSGDAELGRQAHEYLRGHVAALFVQYAQYRHGGNLERALRWIPQWLVTQAAREGLSRALAVLRIAPHSARRPILAEVTGYLRGLAYLPLVLEAPRTSTAKAPLGAFLRGNPFPHPYTEGFFYREKMRAVHRVAPATAPREVLEVGGGQSGMARLLYPGARITTIDLDPSYADSPVNQDPMVTFLAADATDLPFPDASFDVVTMLDVLEHIPDDRAAAREAQRVVRPGGHILVSSPNERWRSPYHRVMRPICPSDEDMIERWGHVRRGYSPGDFERLLGSPLERRADFINPVTVICHDLAFSRLPGRVRRALAILIAPLTWLGYALQPRGARGTETAASWRRPPA